GASRGDPRLLGGRDRDASPAVRGGGAPAPAERRGTRAIPDPDDAAARRGPRVPRADARRPLVGLRARVGRTHCARGRRMAHGAPGTPAPGPGRARWPARLAVVPQQVVNTVCGCESADAGVGSVVIVVMEP